MTILDYTDLATVRALLGVNYLELADATLLLPMYVLTIEDELDALNEKVLPQYNAVKLISANARSILQARFYEQVRTYSAVAAAISVMPSLPMAVPQSLEDGKAKQGRIADPFTALGGNLKDALLLLGQRVLDSLVKLDPTTTLRVSVGRVFAGVAGLGTDPVTGA